MYLSWARHVVGGDRNKPDLARGVIGIFLGRPHGADCFAEPAERLEQSGETASRTRTRSRDARRHEDSPAVPAGILSLSRLVLVRGVLHGQARLPSALRGFW